MKITITKLDGAHHFVCISVKFFLDTGERMGYNYRVIFYLRYARRG